MKKIKYVAASLAVLIFLVSLVYADVANPARSTVGSDASETTEELKAWYVIEDGNYDEATQTQTYEVYLDMEECALYSGAFGMSYDALLKLNFELDTDNFQYHTKFYSENGMVAFEWYFSKELPKPEDEENPPQVQTMSLKERVHFATIRIDDVVMTSTTPAYPSGWNTKTIKQLNWLTTDISKQDKYIKDEDGICLNRQIWRAVEKEDDPIVEPSVKPSVEPSAEPTTEPSEEPTTEPTVDPTTDPTEEPTTAPTAEPTDEPSSEPLENTASDETNETVEPGKTETVDGYYQGWDMWDEDNLQFIDIGFIFNSGYNLPDKDGRAIVGFVHSYHPHNPVTFTLYPKGSTDSAAQLVQPTYTTVKPNGKVTCGYSLDVNLPGEYTLEVKKDVHLTYTVDVTVPDGTEDVSLDEITLFCGDISGDEKIKQNDRTTLLKYLNMQTYDGTSEAALRSDLNGDGKVTIHDLNIFKTYYNRSYKEAVG